MRAHHTWTTVPKVFGWSASDDRTDVGAFILMEMSKFISVIRIYGLKASNSSIKSALWNGPSCLAGSLSDWWYKSQCRRFLVCSLFQSPSPIPLIVLRAGCHVVCTSYHQYPTKLARRICSFTIGQWSHVSIYASYLTRLPHSSPRSITSRILPPDEISFPVLWHTDLHAGNIMVKPEDKPDVVGILDWQGMSVTPMLSVFAKFVSTPEMIVSLYPWHLNTLPPESWLWTISGRPKSRCKTSTTYGDSSQTFRDLDHLYWSVPACCTRASANGVPFPPFVQRIEDMVWWGSPPSHLRVA